VNTRRISLGGQTPDPLLDIWLSARIALAPLGIRVDADTLGLWRDMQARGALPFTASGEFRPEVTRRIEDAATLMRASTADEPSESPDAAGPPIR
jgi:hypothetical protein